MTDHAKRLAEIERRHSQNIVPEPGTIGWLLAEHRAAPDALTEAGIPADMGTLAKRIALLCEDADQQTSVSDRLMEEKEAASDALTAAGIPDDGRSLAERVKALAERQRGLPGHLVCPMCTGKGQVPERVAWGPENGGDPPPHRRPHRATASTGAGSDGHLRRSRGHLLVAAHKRIAAMPREQRHEAGRRLSCSWSAPETATAHGARVVMDGGLFEIECQWPDGERYPVGVEAQQRLIEAGMGAEAARKIG